MRINLFLGIWGTGILCYLSQFQPKGAQLLPWFVVVLAMMCASFLLASFLTRAWGIHVYNREFREIDRRSHR